MPYLVTVTQANKGLSGRHQYCQIFMTFAFMGAEEVSGSKGYSKKKLALIEQRDDENNNRKVDI